MLLLWTTLRLLVELSRWRSRLLRTREKCCGGVEEERLSKLNFILKELYYFLIKNSLDSLIIKKNIQHSSFFLDLIREHFSG